MRIPSPFIYKIWDGSNYPIKTETEKEFTEITSKPEGCTEILAVLYRIIALGDSIHFTEYVSLSVKWE